MTIPFDHLAELKVGAYRVQPDVGLIQANSQSTRLEPKVMSLLMLLASRPGEAFSRELLERELWAGVVVGEDTLARTIFKLRRALQDKTSNPQYIETIPKRGYRLIADVNHRSVERSHKPIPQQRITINAITMLTIVSIVIVGIWFGRSTLKEAKVDSSAYVLQRAEHLYMQFNRESNEAAIALYERALLEHPNDVDAHAGLANALVQRVLRWPNSRDDGRSITPGLAGAISDGRLNDDAVTSILQQARVIAERAVELAPNNADVHKALGLTLSAHAELERAKQSYARAIELEPYAWRARVNFGELLVIDNDRTAAIAQFEKAYNIVEQLYAIEPQYIGSWQARLGVLIGNQYENKDLPHVAAGWYRKVLMVQPYETTATLRLINILSSSGSYAEARLLCTGLTEKIGDFTECQLTD